jgi:hypothetical protein
MAEYEPGKIMSKKQRTKIYLDSLYHAEVESGRDSVTLRKRFNALGIDTSGKIALRDLCRVLVMGKDLAMEQKLIAETETIKRKERQDSGLLCEIEAVKEELMAWHRALRSDLNAFAQRHGALAELDAIFKKHHEFTFHTQPKTKNEKPTK